MTKYALEQRGDKIQVQGARRKKQKTLGTWVEVAGEDLKHLTMDIILNGRECKMES